MVSKYHYDKIMLNPIEIIQVQNIYHITVKFVCTISNAGI